LIGNNLFIPGSRFYLNPMGLGSEKLGDPFQGVDFSKTEGKVDPNNPTGNERSYANLIGLGGYHLITKVTSTISNGTFETSINCKHEGWREEIFNQADTVASDPVGEKPPSGEEAASLP